MFKTLTLPLRGPLGGERPRRVQPARRRRRKDPSPTVQTPRYGRGALWSKFVSPSPALRGRSREERLDEGPASAREGEGPIRTDAELLPELGQDLDDLLLAVDDLGQEAGAVDVAILFPARLHQDARLPLRLYSETLQCL